MPDSESEKVSTTLHHYPFPYLCRNPSKQQPPTQESFESYYLKQVTAEFADDIDKIRNASDFNERSVPVLIQALKQSAANFTEEEKERGDGYEMIEIRAEAEPSAKIRVILC